MLYLTCVTNQGYNQCKGRDYRPVDSPWIRARFSSSNKANNAERSFFPSSSASRVKRSRVLTIFSEHSILTNSLASGDTPSWEMAMHEKVASSTDRNSSQFRSLSQNQLRYDWAGLQNTATHFFSTICSSACSPSSFNNPRRRQISRLISLHDKLVAHMLLPISLLSNLCASSKRPSSRSIERCR